MNMLMTLQQMPTKIQPHIEVIFKKTPTVVFVIASSPVLMVMVMVMVTAMTVALVC